ncbi:MAG: TolC family protein [Verrucomicrobiales bacterium]|nr:TolC family protein [Verrucomicrobiales bacterium]
MKFHFWIPNRAARRQARQSPLPNAHLRLRRPPLRWSAAKGWLLFVMLLALDSSLRTFSLEAAAADPSQVAGGVIITPKVISDYLELARTNHPRFKAADARIAATQADAESVRSWEDPTLKWGGTLSSDRGPDLREEGDLIYGAEQKLPLYGKATLQRKSIAEETRAAAAFADYQLQIVRRDLALALLRAALARRSVEVAQEDLAQLHGWARNAEQRYAVGGSSQIEVLRLQNELTRVGEEMISRTNELSHQQVTVNRLLNRPEFTPVPPLLLPEMAEDLPYSEKLVELALRNEPQLRMLRQEVQVAESRVALVRRQRLPELSLGIEGRQFSGDGGFREGTFMVGMNLPWFNRRFYRKDLEREQRKAEAAAWDAQDYALGVREEIHLLLVRVDAARREAVAIATKILPRSELALRTAASSWMANRGAFNDMMEGRRMHLESQLGYARAIAEQHQALSELLLCCGLTDLEELELIRKPTAAIPPKQAQEVK